MPVLSPFLPSLHSFLQNNFTRNELVSRLLLLLYLAAPHLKNKTIQPTLICPSLLSFTFSVNPPQTELRLVTPSLYFSLG